ncbi:hypothetical protein QTP70_033875, partial [Hemibagrus guttatus]
MSEILHHSPPAKETSHISSLSDYRPVVMKCFEKLVRSHITSLLPASFDSHQFAYRGNRSTEDTVATALHAALCHLEKQGSYVRTLFVDYSSEEGNGHYSLYISGDCVERVADFQFLGVQIEEGLTWSTNTSELLKKAQQRLYFLRVLRKNNVTQRLLVSTSCSVAQRKALQRR